MSFKKVMSVVPKVWKRLMVTFLSIFVAFFAYNAVAILVFSLVFIAWFVFYRISLSRSLLFVWNRSVGSVLHGVCVYDHSLAIG